MKTENREELKKQFISMRGYYFNICGEDEEKFNKKFKDHKLRNLVLKYSDTSFRDVFQTAEKAIKEL